MILLDVGRRQFARVLRKLPVEAFERYGTHNRRGVVRVGTMLKDYVEHVDNHLKFINEKRTRLAAGKVESP